MNPGGMRYPDILHKLKYVTSPKTSEGCYPPTKKSQNSFLSVVLAKLCWKKLLSFCTFEGFLEGFEFFKKTYASKKRVHKNHPALDIGCWGCPHSLKHIWLWSSADLEMMATNTTSNKIPHQFFLGESSISFFKQGFSHYLGDNNLFAFDKGFHKSCQICHAATMLIANHSQGIKLWK